MENLKIYRIDDRYIRYLRSRDSRVQDGKDRKRPYVGVVLHVGSYRYFVPMESPKPNHVNIKPGKHIIKINKGIWGLLGFNNMVPVCDSEVVEYDLSAEADVKYRELCYNQLQWCNNNKADIYNCASRTYFDVVNHKNKFLLGISCNFKKLEKACNEYSPCK